MIQPVVEIDNVTKTFDTLIAVDQISLSVERGQTLGLIGPNGAGKTTLLRVISSLAKPDQGDVRIDGESVTANPRAVRKMLGFMPAEFGSPRNFSIGEYLEYFGCMHGIPRPERPARIRDVCELTDLSGREDVMVKGLSTGNRQRLLLAKTLLHDPQLLILDEPASGLDPRARNELRSIVRTLASLGKTIIISSHILPDIEEISDHIGIMEAGRLVLDGNINAIRERHQSTSRVIKLRIPVDEIPRARQLLSALPQVSSCDHQDDFLAISTEEPNANFILSTVLQHDIRVLQFAEGELNLEDIFMKSTAGKVT